MDDVTMLAESGEDKIDVVETKPCLLIRAGRGRTGGSTGLDLAIQRARHAGRRVKPLDGDLRSKTLSTLYPATGRAGEPVLDGASAPETDELPDIKKWLSSEFDAMASERVSRALDLSGGDRVMQEYVRDLALAQFCADFGIMPTVAVFLGPDLEDFRHAEELLGSGAFPSERTILVLNEGVIRHGQTTSGAFNPIMAQPEFESLVERGVRPVFLRRLTCMSVLRERDLGFYDAVAGMPDSKGVKASPTLHHMTKTWLNTFEREFEMADVLDWLP
jgi:hypothetical protein